MGSVAASGGYYVASCTDGIIANPGTITGSIGVIMGYTKFQEIFNKIGLKSVVIKSGSYKDIGSPVRKMTEKEKELLRDIYISNGICHNTKGDRYTEGRGFNCTHLKTGITCDKCPIRKEIDRTLGAIGCGFTEALEISKELLMKYDSEFLVEYLL